MQELNAYLYTVTEGATIRKVREVMNDLIKRFKANPNKKFLVMYTLAGHGIHMNGKQYLVLNEFNGNEDGGFYNMSGIEEKIRTLADDYPNSYHIAFFACCREIHRPELHSGCFKSEEKAEKHYLDLKTKRIEDEDAK